MINWKKSNIELFHFQIICTLLLLATGIAFTIKFNYKIIAIVLFILLALFTLFLIIIFYSNFSLERIVLNLLKNNDGQLEVEKIKEYFIHNSNYDTLSENVTDTILKKLSNKNIIRVKNNIVELIQKNI